MKDIKTVILRFRDLITKRDETVEKHQQIAKAKGHVWWGWWNKGGETVPGQAFRTLVQKTRGKKGLTIYLMDSGQEKLYKANCIDIAWEATHEHIRSPNKQETPSYYNTQEYLAWFKLRDIEPVAQPEKVLHRLSYRRVDAFFETGISRYDAFYGKQVHSVSELRQQDRTIWFVRPFRQRDPTHEISLLAATKIRPDHFAGNYFASPSSELLWMSDLHFSVDRHHAFPKKSSTSRFELGHRIEMMMTKPRGAVEKKYGHKIEKVAGVILSGDFAWKALPEEFEQAAAFIRRLNTWTPLRGEQLVICPGNHDVRFSDDPARKDTEITVAPDEARAAYSTFYQDLFYLTPNEYMSSGRRFLIGNVFPVDIVSLNSQMLEQRPGSFQGHGFVGQEQMTHAARQMGWDVHANDIRPVRIVVLHHHVLPVTYTATPEADYGYSVVLDAEALIRWMVDHRVDLVLHGHMHQPSCVTLNRPVDPSGQQWHSIHVLGMGSSGVSSEHLGEVGKNTFGVLKFNRGFVNISIFTIHPTNQSALVWSVDLKLSH